MKTVKDEYRIVRFFKISSANANDVRRGVGKRWLKLQELKTVNILYRPDVLPKGVYRRDPPLSYYTTKTRLRLQYTREAKILQNTLDFDPMDTDPLPDNMLSNTEGFPYPLAEHIKILGIALGDHLAMDAHITSLVTRAQMRKGTLAKLDRST